MTSTKLVLLGIFIIVAGLAVDSATMHFVSIGTIGFDAAQSLGYVALGLFVVGFIVGAAGFIVGVVRR
ncbi:MAG TPA: hypothetical protein VF116_15200 [Ktedonobacterales bacterium]